MGERRRLTSWKEVADHLGCTVRSAQRWEKDGGLPVYRVAGAPGHRVFAYTDELDAWIHAGNSNGSAIHSSEPTIHSNGFIPPSNSSFLRSKESILPEDGSGRDGPRPEPPGPAESRSDGEISHAPDSCCFTDADTHSAVVPEPDPIPTSGDASSTLRAARPGLPPTTKNDAASPSLVPFPPSAVITGGPGPFPPSRLHVGTARRKVWRLAGGLAVALLAAWTIWLTVTRESKPPMRLHQVKVSGKVLFGLDDAGQTMWRREFPRSLEAFGPVFPPELSRSTAILDLDRDGRSEILVVLGQDKIEQYAPWALYCLDDGGNIRWTYQPGEALEFGNERCDDNWVFGFDTADLDGNGRLEVIVLSHHHRLYPSKVTLLDPKGGVGGEYLNSGRVEYVNYSDLDGDGTKEILAGGCHNGYMRACLFVLDSRRITGGSPQPDHPGYDCRKRRADSARYYLLFPRDPVLDRLHTFALVNPISVIPGTIIARIASGIASPPLSGTMDYILRPDLSLERAEASSDYEMLYRHLFREGMLSEPFSPTVARNLDPILYWNGDQFTPQPAMNRHWREK